MMYNGFIKVCAITPSLKVGNPHENVSEMLRLVKGNKASFAVFPELSVTGYTCGDLFFQSMLLNETKDEIRRYVKENEFDGVSFLGAPFQVNGSLYNCAFVVYKNKLIGIVPKRSIPNSKEFYEKRWFRSATSIDVDKVYFMDEWIPFGNLIFDDNDHNLHFGVEICEDMWAPIAPSNILAYYGANLIFNLSGSNETLGKSDIRKSTVIENSRKNCGGYVYASAGVNESTSETVFSGHNIVASCGNLIKETENFSLESEIIYADIDLFEINFKRRMNTNLHDLIGLDMKFNHICISLDESSSYTFEDEIDSTPFVPKKDILNDFYKIASIQEFALYKRLKCTKSKTLLIGVSGGLDSTLALLVAVEAFKKLNKPLKDIIAVTMPGFATSTRTKSNAKEMMSRLGVTVLEKSIVEECLVHFKTIDQNPDVHDITYENTQARLRTMILMNLANKYNGIVLGTGDMSELALGWCTYNGDQMSMYGINCGLPKTLVRFMIENYAKTKFSDISNVLLDIIDTPISPELSSNDQKTEDFIGKYEVNDFILYRFLSCGDDATRIEMLLSKAFDLNQEAASTAVKNFFNRFFMSQFKRQALPDGPKILDVSLSPRSDFRMPSDIER